MEKALSSIADITMGISPKGITYNREKLGLPLLNGPTEFGEVFPNCTFYTNSSIKECKKGDLIFCVRASTGVMNWADKNYSLGRGVCSIRGKNFNDTKYIQYCLEVKLEQLLQLSTSGSVFSNLSKNDLENFKIPFSKNRYKIISIISNYENLIQINYERIKILEKITQNIYQNWFTKFNFPGKKNISLINSELGKIPKGWKILTLGNIAKINKGKSYKSEEISTEAGKLFINLKCIAKGGGFRRDGLKKYTGTYNNTHTVSRGDIVIAVTDMTQERAIIGRVARIGDLVEQIYIISLDLVSIMPFEKIGKNYLYSLLRFSNFSEIVKNYANGTNVLHLNPKSIENFKILLPPFDLIQQYEKIVKQIFNKIDIHNNVIQKLKKIRNLILPKLIYGKIDISNLNIKENNKVA
jgi:type I restriction enzyme S subunit